jgi:SAM-dependent methyltransferase
MVSGGTAVFFIHNTTWPAYFVKVSISGYIKAVLCRLAAARQKKATLQTPGPEEIKRSDWMRSTNEPTAFYLDCFRFFHQRLPAELREHRAYFNCEGRGFGEDPFHVLWFLLFREFKPKNFLEIGVFRGQTLSLAALLSRLNHLETAVCGISPFSSAGDSVSRYRATVEFLQDTLKNFKHFNLEAPELVRAFSTDPDAARFIASKEWDLIYIDGNHDYEIVLKDWEICSRHLKPGGVIVLDDSALNTQYRAPAFATAGHPGPSRLAEEIDRKKFHEILRVGHNRVFQKIA